MSVQTFVSGRSGGQRALVVIFLRGAADGLSLVAPVEDDAYYRARPRLAVAKKDAVRLDGFFGLHPLLSPLEAAWKEGDLTIVHGAGSEDITRSHFDAQDTMEHGGLAAGGWLGRFLAAGNRGKGARALSAVAIGRLLPECLIGAPAAAVMERLEEFSFRQTLGQGQMAPQLRALYEAERDFLGAAGSETFAALSRMEQLRSSTYRPGSGAVYDPKDDFAQGLMQVAQLIKADVGLEAASVDVGGWDTHFVQGTVLEPLLRRLAGGLAAFRQDLGPAMRDVSVVVMTEFGRRVAENSSFGTDHGRGSVMFVMGGGTRGGRVIGPWAGLQEEKLEGPGDLPVIHNYRDVLSSVLRRHGATEETLPVVFPDWKETRMEV